MQFLNNYVNCLQFKIRYEKVECPAPVGGALVKNIFLNVEIFLKLVSKVNNDLFYFSDTVYMENRSRKNRTLLERYSIYYIVIVHISGLQISDVILL